VSHDPPPPEAVGGTPEGVPEGVPEGLPSPTGPASPEPPGGGVPAGTTTGDGGDWQRLDPRMLLVGPLHSLKQFAIPLLVALLGLSGSPGGLQPWFVVPALGVPVLLGLLPWLTTRYRMTETQFVRHSGLLNRKQLTAPLDRVRSVDLESSLLHRALGLTKVQIGTGVDDTRIELDSLATAQARELRASLLARLHANDWAETAGSRPEIASFGPQRQQPGAPTEAAHTTVPATSRPASPPPAPTQLLARIDWSWLRFAPFSLSKLAVVAGVLGALTQLGDSLPLLDQEHIDSAWRWATSFAIPLLVVSLVSGALLAWVVVSVAGYVVQWWNLTLTRERGSLHLTSGLFTTRSVSVEEVKVRGVEMTEPLLLRLVDGAELATLATGVGSGGTTKVLPPCPREVCQTVGTAVLGSCDTWTAPLAEHGRGARIRQHVQAQWTALVVIVVLVGVPLAFGWPWWLSLLAVAAPPLAALAAEASYRHLGHLLTPTHLVAGSPAVNRRRTVLERDGVIGWVVRQSFFQRRRGLATLIATTAAGHERVVVTDVPLPRAVAMAARVTPEPVAPFLAGSVPAGPTSAAPAS
jgi:putative membrane protein